MIPTSDFFTDGLALMSIGALAAWGRVIPEKIIDLFDRYAIVSLEILDRDEAYQWFEKWIAEQPYTGRALKLNVTTRATDTGHEAITTPAAPGIHTFKWNGKRIWLWRFRKEVSGPGGEAYALYRERVKIRILSRDRSLPTKLIAELRSAAYPIDDRSIEIRTNSYGHWQNPVRRAPRLPETVVLADGMMDGLIADAQDYFAGKEQYIESGTPWRRGYLFEGTPGGGKTSTALALATALELPIYNLTLTGRFEPGALINLLQMIKQRAIVLVEDVDDVDASREREDNGPSDTSSGVTTGELLNAVDGVQSPEGVLFIYTTNHAGVLDSALLRPGRIDRRFEFGSPTSEQRAQIAFRFNGGDLGKARDFAGSSEEAASMAEIQERLRSDQSVSKNGVTP